MKRNSIPGELICGFNLNIIENTLIFKYNKPIDLDNWSEKCDRNDYMWWQMNKNPYPVFKFNTLIYRIILAPIGVQAFSIGFYFFHHTKLPSLNSIISLHSLQRTSALQNKRWKPLTTTWLSIQRFLSRNTNII